ncbi:MFS transporter [Sulfolobus islandicus]|uniref:Major facilitator superfamily MFS_1 n=1 Tax=Saccharolobus islandicus (strain HVE10/4) TaxID=930943 RepID=F0NL37_SACI0|nr:MFS transporter [Sulfolobus islandicus]ADX83528.1 major facilitator superfamily MFS_1 [Sulfolobus islandicus HVE10/4]WCM37729.1 MFS transporter [Sulfolobus islandicus]
MSQYSKEEIDRGIKKIYETVLNTKNITSRYIVILALASLWLDAYDFASMTFGTASLKSTFPSVPSVLISLAIGAVQLGAIIGAVVGGWLNDRIGRRNMFILNMILFTGMAILGGLSTNIIELSIFRGLLGFALGADTATGFAYIFEYLEKKQRLFWSNLWQIQWYIMYEVTIALIVVPFFFTVHSLTSPLLWRIIMIVGGVLALVILLLRGRIPESVLWLAYQGKLATAKKILKHTYGIDLPEVPDVDLQLRAPARGVRSAFSIFRASKWRELVYSFNGNFEQGFIFYTFGFYVPYILLALKLAGPLASIVASAFLYAGGVIGGYLTAWLTPKIGTKSQYVIGAIGEGISVGLIALTYIYHLPLIYFVVFSFLFYFFHVIGPASQGMTSINAFFGAKERGTAAGWGYFWVKLAAFIGLLIGIVGITYNPVSLTLGLAIYGVLTGIVGLIIGYDTRTYKLADVEELEENPQESVQ